MLKTEWGVESECVESVVERIGETNEWLVR